MTRGYTVQALGEVAIRCRDLAMMKAFYRDVVGSKPLKGDYAAHIAFFDIGPGYGGHTTVLALFEQGTPEAGAGSTLHHVALTVDANAQDAAETWLAKNGVETRWQHFPWIGWRGLFFSDPEGNTIEFVSKYEPPGADA